MNRHYVKVKNVQIEEWVAVFPKQAARKFTLADEVRELIDTLQEKVYALVDKKAEREAFQEELSKLKRYARRVKGLIETRYL